MTEERKAYKASWYQANKDRLAAKAKRRYLERRDEVLDKAAAYREANRALLAEKAKSYYQNNHEKARAAQRAYRAANPQVYAEWFERNRAVLLAKKSARKKANPAQNAAHASAYHAAKLQRVVPFTDMAEVAKVYAEAAAQRARGIDVEVDHVIPLRGKNVSGLHVHWNLRVIPSAENRKKYNKVLT